MIRPYQVEANTAIEQARAAATRGDVVIMGGGDVIGQALEQGLVDELRIHLAPMLLGGGTPLIKPGTRHRLTAVEDTDIFEVSTPEADDVVRLADRYGRAP